MVTRAKGSLQILGEYSHISKSLAFFNCIFPFLCKIMLFFNTLTGSSVYRRSNFSGFLIKFGSIFLDSAVTTWQVAHQGLTDEGHCVFVWIYIPIVAYYIQAMQCWIKCNRWTNAGVFVLLLKVAFYSITSRYIVNGESLIFKDFTKENEAFIINSNYF